MHPAVAVALGAVVFCAAASRAGLGLGEREAAELLARRASGVSHSCFCASVPNLMDRIADQRVVDAHDHARRRARARDLLHRQRVRDGVDAGAALLLGDRDAEEPELGHALDELRAGTVLAIDLGGLRQRLRSVAKSRAVVWTSFCSSVRSKFIGLLALELGGRAWRGTRACPRVDRWVANRSAESCALEGECLLERRRLGAAAISALARRRRRAGPWRRSRSATLASPRAMSSAGREHRVDEADAQRLVGVDRGRRCSTAPSPARRRRGAASRCVPPKPGDDAEA